jgi:hypothetical protein
MSETHNQFNISGFPRRLRLLLAHKAIDAGMKLNQYIIHILWQDVKCTTQESDKFICVEKEKTP